MTATNVSPQKDIIEQQKTMSSITITIPDDVMKTFTDFKLRHKHKYVLMEIDQERSGSSSHTHSSRSS